VIVLVGLPDYPDHASWLSSSEKVDFTKNLDGNKASWGPFSNSWKELRAVLLDWRLYLHYLHSLLVGVPFLSFSVFIPTLVSGLGFTGPRAQLMAVPPFALSFMTVILTAWITNKTKIWSLMAIVCSVLAAAAFTVQGNFLLLGVQRTYENICHV